MALLLIWDTNEYPPDSEKQQGDIIVAKLLDGVVGGEESQVLGLAEVEAADMPDEETQGVFVLLEQELESMKAAGDPSPQIANPFMIYEDEETSQLVRYPWRE